MSFPWMAHINRKTRRINSEQRAPWRRTQFTLCIAMALAASSPGVSAAPPVPSTQIPLPATNFVTYGNASIDPNTPSNVMKIDQGTSKVILNWRSFDIGPNASVQFNQASTDWIALNRIGGIDPSRIFGSLTATGQVYLLNPNGIVFGNGAQIDVHSLLASTLNMSDDVFKRGIADKLNFNQPDLTPGLAGKGIVVEAGARISGAADGKIMMFAPNITNSGRISAGADGQVILAAGDSVYLWVETAPNKIRNDMRGLLVEVNGGGTVTNLGDILAKHGDITLMGLAVNQLGRVSATSSVLANGSIHLFARDTINSAVMGTADAPTPTATRGGTVRLGQDSVTEVVPDVQDTATAIDKQKQLTSQVEITGKTILLEGDGTHGAMVTARGGDNGGRIAIAAQENPSAAREGVNSKTTAKVYIAGGVTLDTSGLRDVVLPMERNVVTLELRGDQLKDLPLQKDGFLKGKTVSVDVRQGSKIVDPSFYQDGIQRTVAERSVKGGTIDIRSSGDAIVAPGARMNVSGGEVHYRDGYIKTTKLVDTNGRVYDIANAPVDRVYLGFGDTFVRRHDKWGMTESWNVFGNSRGRFEAGYVQGFDAGTVRVSAPSKLIEGEFAGNVTVGPHQRVTPPQGGKLVVDYGNTSTTTAGPGVVFNHEHLLNKLISQTQFDPTTQSLPSDTPLVLSPDLFAPGGLHRLDVASRGNIDVQSNLQLPAGGELALTGANVNIAADIAAPGGKVSATAVDFGTVTVAGNRRVDVSGQWVNDRLNNVPGTDALAIDGGRISLAGGVVDQRSGSMLAADGGGWLDARGRLTAGKGGAIKLNGSVLNLGGDRSAYALANGGTLDITTSRICITEGDVACTQGAFPAAVGQRFGTLTLAPNFFTSGGFGNYSLTANVSGLNIAHDVVVTPRQENFVLNSDYVLQASAGSIRGFSHLESLPAWQRAPTNISLTLKKSADDTSAFAQFAPLYIERGAAIHTDAGATVTLASQGSLWIDGTIDAPAGTIGLSTEPFIADTEQPAQAIWLSSTAQLLARGAVVSQPTDNGMRAAAVLSGGAVRINAPGGYVVTDPNSVIDVSAAPATTLDLPAVGGAYVPTTVAASAGAIEVSGNSGLFLDGILRGHAADGAQSAGGTLAVSMSPISVSGASARPQIVVASGTAQLLPSTLHRGDVLGSILLGAQQQRHTFINDSTINAGGFDSLTLRVDRSRGDIVLHDGVNLVARTSIGLFASDIVIPQASTASLVTGYLRIGSPGAGYIPEPVSPGGGTLKANAQLIDLIGKFAVHADDITLASQNDIRLIGDRQSGLAGSLTVGNNLTLTAEQIYPTTFTDYSLSAAHSINVKRTPGTAGEGTPILSAGGRLNFYAPEIVNEGVIKAPLGEIGFTASNRVALSAGSVTSTSAENQLIPFGIVQQSKDWVYGLDANGDTISAATVLQQPPEKRIRITTPNAAIAAGATIDVRGGGDLYAYEFTPGPPGRGSDPLASATSFAIVPGLASGFAPYDQQYYVTSGSRDPASSANPFNSIRLAGFAGLADGVYPLLPARYALLPGAYLVTPLGNNYPDWSPQRNVGLVDGSAIVAGKNTVTGTADGSTIQDSRWSAFALRSGAQIRREADYRNYFANDFFTQSATAMQTAVPRLPVDAGRLVLDASRSLQLDGNLLASPGTGGRGAQVDIAATKIAVVGDVSQAPSGYLALDAARLTAFGAESLLLGGTRTSTAQGDEVLVRASDVIVDTAGKTFSGAELILAAKDHVTVKSGSVVKGEGTVSGAASDLILGFHIQDTNNDGSINAFDTNRGDVNGDGVINALDNISADGALLRVAAGAQTAIRRERTQIHQTTGVLQIDSGATLSAKGSIALDATLDTRSQGTIAMDHGSLSIGANRIGLGDIPTGTLNPPSFVLSSALAHSAAFDELYLRSYSSIDIYGSAQVGANNLVLDAASITGHGNTGDVAHLSAQRTMTFTNSGSLKPTASATADGHGGLVASAGNVVLVSGTQAIQGFNRVDINAAHELVGRGVGDLQVAADLHLNAGRITGERAAAHSIAAVSNNGTSAPTYYGVTMDRPTTTTATFADSAWGARFDITGSQINDNGLIDVTAGTVNLVAKNGDVVLGTGAAINAGGGVKSLDNTPVYAPGGQVTLVASGNAVVQAGARIDVAGTAQGGDAGSVAIQTQGQALIDGTLSAATVAGYVSGSANFDVGQLADFGALNRKLDDGGFFESRAVRVRNGDIAVGQTLKAHTVKLTADRGGIVVDSTIDASGTTGGQVQLAARDDIVLGGASRIDAHASGAGKHGGAVEVATTGEGDASLGYIRVLPGAQIDVGGGAGGDNGRVYFRAPRIGNDIKISGGAVGTAPLANNAVANAAHMTAEAFKVYNTVASGDIGQTLAQRNIAAETASFMQNNSASARLPGFDLIPGVEIRNPNGAIALNQSLDLSTWRYGGKAGALTVCARDGIVIGANLTDGFSNGQLMTGNSWSYRLIAGADQSSADIEAITRGANADLTVNADRMVRTGTGFIHIAAAHDMVLQPKGLNNVSPGVIYTAGAATPLATGAIASDVTGDQGLYNSNRFVPYAYPDHGGDISIAAGNDVKGAPTDQLHTEWLLRVGPDINLGTRGTGWTVAFENFRQNVAALGGGNVTVNAGGNVDQLSVSIPTIGKQIGDTENRVQVLGGGDLKLDAGGDIRGGYFYVGRGNGALRADGALTTGRKVLPNDDLNAVIVIGDGSFNVQTRGNLTLGSVLDPTMTPPLGLNATDQYFASYTPTTAVSLVSVGGDISLNNNTDPLFATVPDSLFVGSAKPKHLKTVYPGTLSVLAPQGAIGILNSGILFPAPKGNLTLIAGTDVRFTPTASMRVSDSDVRVLPTIYSTGSVGWSDTSLLEMSAVTPVHSLANQPDRIADTTPVHIVAQDGDIANATLFLPKSTRLYAGNDITNLQFTGQNVNAHDVTEIQAGRDVAVPIARNSSGGIVGGTAQIGLAGPGGLEVMAGRNIDLGASAGIVTTGNHVNMNLPSGGADVTVLAGVGAHAPDYAGFMAQYFGDNGGEYRTQIGDYMRKFSGDTKLTDADAWAAFRVLPLANAKPMILQAFYNELRVTGRAAAADPRQGYRRGFDAIAKLFPDALLSPDTHGDLTLYFSKIKTLDGGDINLLVPRGKVNAGLARSPFASATTDALGIVTETGGDVNAMVQGDFLVNASRVFANRGGNILMWSSAGNIDAGRGAKTALNVVNLAYSTNADGTKTTLPPVTTAGSGIRAFTAPGVPPGNVDLIAPQGVINAGDAGIGSQGNLSIAALQVVGGDNIQVAGTSSGVPVADTSGIGAGLGHAGDTAGVAKPDDATKNLNDQNRERDGLLSIEVLSFGDLDQCRPTATPGMSKRDGC